MFELQELHFAIRIRNKKNGEIPRNIQFEFELTVPDDKEEFFVLENNSGRLCSPFTNPSFPSVHPSSTNTSPKTFEATGPKKFFLKKKMNTNNFDHGYHLGWTVI